MKNPSVLKQWYEGRYVPPDNPPGSGVIFLMGHYERHWSARAAHAVASFWLKEWKWIIGTTIAVAGLALALSKLP